MDDAEKIMRILSATNPDPKITAVAAMESSQKTSNNKDIKPLMNELFYDPAPTFDLKNCLFYFSGKPGIILDWL